MKTTTPLVLLGAVALVGLTGCSGGGTSGVYYGEYNAVSNSSIDGDFVRLTIDGADVVFDRITCDGADEDKMSQGLLNDAQDTVSWTVEGNYHGTDPFTANTDHGVVTLAQTTYSKEGSDAAQILIDDYIEQCTDSEEEWTNPL